METHPALKRINDKKLPAVKAGDEVIPGVLVVDAPSVGCGTPSDEFGCLFRHGYQCPRKGGGSGIEPVLCLDRFVNGPARELWFADKQEYLTWKLTK